MTFDASGGLGDCAGCCGGQPAGRRELLGTQHAISTWWVLMAYWHQGDQGDQEFRNVSRLTDYIDTQLSGFALEPGGWMFK